MMKSAGERRNLARSPMHLVFVSIPVAVLLLSTLIAATSGTRWGKAGSPPAACAAEEFRQFDFFAGDWDTYDVADSTKIVARNRVTIILDGCVLREVYQQTNGLVGESFSLYDASRGRWHQSWFTNRGSLLLLDGGLEGDRMVLTGRKHGAAGGP